MKYAEVIEIIARYPQRAPRPVRPPEAAAEMRQRLIAARALRPGPHLTRSLADRYPTTVALVAMDRAAVEDAARTIWATSSPGVLRGIVARADPHVAARLRELAQRHGHPLEQDAA